VQGAPSASAGGGAGAGAGSTTGIGNGSGTGPGVAGEASPAAGAPPIPSEIVQPHVPRLIPPRVITSAGTEYPVDAFRLTVRRQDLGPALAFDGVEGTVGVRALVLADGTVGRIEVSISSGSDALDRAATETVRRWRFLPATRDGAAIDAYVTVKIRYVVR